MGVRDLLKEAREHCCRDFHLKEARRKRIGIDISGWMHMTSPSVNNEEKTRTIRSKLLLLLNYIITPVVVFDGLSLPAKAKTQQKRKESIDRQRRKRAPVSGRTTEFTEEVKKLCQEMGIEYYVAPYEADGQLAFLQHIGYIDYIITNDSDFILLGCTNVIYDLNKEHGKLYLREKLRKILPRLPWKRYLFQLLCAIIDSDYFRAGIHGISWKKGLELYEKLYKLNFEPDEIPNATWKELLKTVDEMLTEKQKGDPSRPQGDELKKKLEMVLQTYLYQQVYDPRSNGSICPLNPYKPGKTSKDYPFAGVLNKEDLHVIDFYIPPKECNEDVETRKRCSICTTYIAPSWEKRWKHYKRQHMGKCKICRKEVLGELRLIMHQYDIHNVGNSTKDDDPRVDAKTKRNKLLALARGQLNEKERPECLICAEHPKFKSLDSFRRHMLNTHNQVKGKSHDCKLCDKRYVSATDLMRHIKRFHCRKERPYICFKCNKGFPAYIYLRNHKTLHAVAPFKCKLCNKVLTSQHMKADHMRRRHENAKHFCQMCVTGYKTKQDLNEHLAAYHPETMEEGEEGGSERLKSKIECPICDTWISKDDRYHLATHTHEFGWICKICDQALASGPLLKIHKLLSHQKNAPMYTCRDCGKCYKNPVYLRQHRYRVHAPKLHACQLCDYKTQCRDVLKSHLVTKHTRERWYVCRKCDVSFATLYALRKHFKTANHKRGPLKTKKFSTFEDIPKSRLINGLEHCSVEGCTFKVLKEWHDMKDHLRSFHLENKEENRIFACKYCNKSFRSKTKLNTHQQRCKANSQVYKCIHNAHGCLYTTPNSSDMTKHIKTCSKRLENIEYPINIPTAHRLSLVLYKHVDFVPKPTLLDSRTKCGQRLYACSVQGCKGSPSCRDQPVKLPYGQLYKNHVSVSHLAKPKEQTFYCAKDPQCTRIFLLPKELQEEHECELSQEKDFSLSSTSSKENCCSSDLDPPPRKKKRIG